MSDHPTGLGWIAALIGFVTNHHVLNVLDRPAKMYAKFKLSVKDAAEVPHPVRSYQIVRCAAASARR